MQIGLDLQDVPLEDVVREVLDILGPAAGDKDISMDYAVEPEDICVRGVRDRIKELILNLADNAVKYTPAKGKVHVRIYETNDTVIIAVRDTGIGIENKHLNRLFERFYRVDPGPQAGRWVARAWGSVSSSISRCPWAAPSRSKAYRERQYLHRYTCPKKTTIEPFLFHELPVLNTTLSSVNTHPV